MPKDQLPPYGAHKRRRTGKDHPAAAPHKRQDDRASGDGDNDGRPRKFLSGPQVCARYDISDMCLWRWLQNAELEFPQPSFVVHRRRFWDEAILRAWELRKISAPARTLREETTA
jgi:predicted DNA-binding transcriptional regulator AlpA